MLTVAVIWKYFNMKSSVTFHGSLLVVWIMLRKLAEYDYLIHICTFFDNLLKQLHTLHNKKASFFSFFNKSEWKRLKMKDCSKGIKVLRSIDLTNDEREEQLQKIFFSVILYLGICTYCARTIAPHSFTFTS